MMITSSPVRGSENRVEIVPSCQFTTDASIAADTAS